MGFGYLSAAIIALIVLLADKLHIADPQSFMRSRHANWE